MHFAFVGGEILHSEQSSFSLTKIHHLRFSVDQLQSELCLEMATWQLLHILAQDRHEEEDKRSQETTMIGNGASDKILAEQLFAQDSLVRQAQACLWCWRGCV